jgi:hypothetical protein
MKYEVETQWRRSGEAACCSVLRLHHATHGGMKYEERVQRANINPMLELTVSPHLREPIAK